MKRRSFIQASLASLVLSSCASPPPLIDKLPKPSEKQKSGRRPGPSIVGILKAASYEQDLFAIIKKSLLSLNIANLKDKTVVLKPNMVECPPDKPYSYNSSRDIEGNNSLSGLFGSKQYYCC